MDNDVPFVEQANIVGGEPGSLANATREPPPLLAPTTVPSTTQFGQIPAPTPMQASSSNQGPSDGITVKSEKRRTSRAPSPMTVDTKPVIPPPQSQMHKYPASGTPGPAPDQKPPRGPRGSRGQQPPQESSRMLNVTDALSYLDAVKGRFYDEPEVYNHFLDIMRDFKTSVIDTPGVIQRVSQLFVEHPDLIQGFNTFLPVGYQIETGVDGSVMVRTPNGLNQLANGPPPRSQQIQHIPSQSSSLPSQPAPYHTPSAAEPSVAGPISNQGMSQMGPGSPPGPTYLSPALAGMQDAIMQHSRESNGSGQALEFQRAIGYVNKIKTRYSNEPEVYKQFLEILGRFQAENKGDIQNQIAALFRGAPDLVLEFKEFAPNPASGSFIGSMAVVANNGEWPSTSGKRKDPTSSLTAPPPKKRKKVVDRDPPPKPPPVRPPKKPKQREPTPEYFENGFGTISTADDQAFFERVKKALENRETYDEFLKLVNLFTQEIIDMRTLVEKASYFLNENTELFIQFKRLVGWEEREKLVREPDQPTAHVRNMAIYVAPPKEELHQRCGPSYRRIPANETQAACSGRDELCRSVLNDEWVSHPTWASEDNSGVQSYKKNQYEEALHKCEEERHEFDFHLEIMSKTISALENINMKISQMSNEEKSTFKLKPGLGLPNKSIYQRIVKKVYGKEPGMEVISTLHDCPAVAVPIVLQRLKAKDEDWRKAQREWNKIWREVDARNFYKSLDHQGVTFKSTDKKAMSAKALVASIEAARDEQLSERAALLDPSLAKTRPSHQLAYEITDIDVMKDATKLVLSYLDQLGTQYSVQEREKIEKWLLDFLVVFFVLDQDEFLDGITGGTAPVSQGALGITTNEVVVMDVDVEMDEGEGTHSGRRTPKNGKGKANGLSTSVNSNDLRKQLLSKTTIPGSRVHSAKASPAMSTSELSAIETVQVVGKMPVDTVWITSTEHTVLPPVPVPSSKPGASPASTRKATFFGNTITYVVLRIFQTLYSRLYLCKEIAAKLAEGNGASHIANPIAYELGLLEGLGPGSMNLLAPSEAVTPQGVKVKPAAHFYENLLDWCEKLFDGDMDQNTFEENLRFMFGTKGYLMFTVDKVIAALIKQIHSAIGDPHSEELLNLLKMERREEQPTTQQIITYRRNAEDIVGQDDNIFRINLEHRVMSIQLLGKNDISTDDAENMAQRWRFYIESYVLTHPTEGVRRDVKMPFLRRNVIDSPLADTGSHAYNGLEIKVCIRTYRLFFGSETEDYFWRFGNNERKEALQNIATVEEKRKARFESWLENSRSKKAANSTKRSETPLNKQ